MNRPPFVPPLKCQGIKTKLVDEIRNLAHSVPFDRWVEPFCGSCVVPLNIQPKSAVLSDSNVHIIRLYREMQDGTITAAKAKAFLAEEGEKLRAKGEDLYHHARNRFNDAPASLDFLFLNRSCFNGVMRFNRFGKFNTPYGHKPGRFAPAYVTKIANQIRRISEVTFSRDWAFLARDFRETLSDPRPNDLIYADPPYAGRHVDYFNSWSEDDENNLAEILKNAPCRFILSTWHSNEFRRNALLDRNWSDSRFQIIQRKHFYHVGSTEDLRHPMIEALVTNFQVDGDVAIERATEQLAFFDRPAAR